jgi:hypothetical protein
VRGEPFAFAPFEAPFGALGKQDKQRKEGKPFVPQGKGDVWDWPFEARFETQRKQGKRETWPMVAGVVTDCQ